MICGPYFLCGLMDDCSGVLRGLGKSLLSTVISLVGSCLLRVVWLLTVFPLSQTLQTIFICYPITWLLTTATSFVVIMLVLKKELAGRNSPIVGTSEITPAA